jgi:hypothetical protein
MTFVPDWERLADARKRVMASGLSRSDAERDLCAAMSDGKIKVRPLFELIKRSILDHQIAKNKRREIFTFMRELQEGVHRYPEPWDSFQAFSTKGVTPSKLDWRKSKFRNAWQVPIHPEMAPMNWDVSIELASADVTRVLIVSGSASRTVNTPSARSTTQQKQAQTVVEQARRWRSSRIERFTERQLWVREWINFAEIAEWCSEEDLSILPNPQKRAGAFDRLASDLLAGEFEENGRSRVLYLHSATTKARMTRVSTKEAIDNNYDGDLGRSQYLSHCWIPRTLFDRWLAKHRLETSPARFRARRGESAGLKAPKRGRPAEYNWDGVKSRLVEYVTENGAMQSRTELLQKCADIASELHPQRRTPDDKTIRAAINKYSLDTAAAGVAPGN